MKKHKEELSIKDIISVILPKLWLVLLVSVAVSALTFVYCNYLKDDTYTSSFDIYIYKDDGNSSASVSDIQAAENMIETYEYIIKTNNFLDNIISELSETEWLISNPDYKDKLTPDSLRSMMSISKIGETGAIKISFTSRDRVYVTELCKNIAPEFPEQVVKSIPKALEVTITDNPKEPLAPNSKNAVRNSLVVFTVACVLTMVCIWIINAFDTTIRDKKKIEDNFDIPVLGAIPRQEVLSKKKEGDDAVQ